VIEKSEATKAIKEFLTQYCYLIEPRNTNKESNLAPMLLTSSSLSSVRNTLKVPLKTLAPRSRSAFKGIPSTSFILV